VPNRIAACALVLLAMLAMAGCAWNDEPPAPQLAMVHPPAAPAPPPPRADFVEVFKSRRQMVLHQGSKVLATYRVMLGLNPSGHKQREGDKRTPEGDYVIDFRNPQSRFYRSLHINYPNRADVMAGNDRHEAKLGGDIFIHGMGFASDVGLYVGEDWTNGCIAVTNAEIEEIWRLVPDGTPIRINP
jgi:murein L,D-transpeptidase YafK